MAGLPDTLCRAIQSRRVRSGQSGFTLLEAIVSMALISTVILALATGLLTSVRSSASAKETQVADGALSAYAENFKGRFPSAPSNPCPEPNDFMVEAPEPDWFGGAGVDSAVVTETEGWDEGGEVWLSCSTNPTLDSGLARLSVSVTVDTGDGDTQEASGQVVVRRDPT